MMTRETYLAWPTSLSRRHFSNIRQEENMNVKRLVLIAVSVGVILMAYPSCDTSKKSYSQEAVMEKLPGEWKNLHYDATQKPARRVFDQQENLTKPFDWTKSTV